MSESTIYLVAAEDFPEAPASIKAFENYADAQVFAAACRAYEKSRPLMPIDGRYENPVDWDLWDATMQAWIAQHPANQFAALRPDGFIVLELTLVRVSEAQ